MKMILLVLSTVLLAGGADAAGIDGRAQGELLRKPYVSAVTAEKREYFLSLPKGYETETGKLWPVILFLHGGGERGDGKADLEKLLLHGPLGEAADLDHYRGPGPGGAARVGTLEEAGHPDVRFTVHEDLPHDVWTRVYEGWDLYNWFLQHRRKQ